MYEDQYTASLQEIIEYSRSRQDKKTTLAFYEWMEFIYKMASYWRLNPPDDFELNVAIEDQSVLTAAQLLNADSEEGVYFLAEIADVILYASNYERIEFITFLMLEDLRNQISPIVTAQMLTL